MVLLWQSPSVGRTVNHTSPVFSISCRSYCLLNVGPVHAFITLTLSNHDVLCPLLHWFSLSRFCSLSEILLPDIAPISVEHVQRMITFCFCLLPEAVALIQLSPIPSRLLSSVYEILMTCLCPFISKARCLFSFRADLSHPYCMLRGHALCLPQFNLRFSVNVVIFQQFFSETN